MEVSNDNNDSTSTTATCWLQRIELDEERDNGLVTLGHVDAADDADADAARCVVVCRPSLWSKQATESLLRDPETPIRLKQRNDKCVPSISNLRGVQNDQHQSGHSRYYLFEAQVRSTMTLEITYPATDRDLQKVAI